MYKQFQQRELKEDSDDGINHSLLNKLRSTKKLLAKLKVFETAFNQKVASRIHLKVFMGII